MLLHSLAWDWSDSSDSLELSELWVVLEHQTQFFASPPLQVRSFTTLEKCGISTDCISDVRLIQRSCGPELLYLTGPTLGQSRPAMLHYSDSGAYQKSNVGLVPHYRGPCLRFWSPTVEWTRTSLSDEFDISSSVCIYVGLVLQCRNCFYNVGTV